MHSVPICPAVGTASAGEAPALFSHAYFNCENPRSVRNVEPVCRGSGSRHRQQMAWLHALPYHNQFPHYLSAVYGRSALAITPARMASFASSLSFFWGHAPARPNVTVTWQCHWRPGCVAEIRTGQLWAPLAEATLNPSLLDWKALPGSLHTGNISKHGLGSRSQRASQLLRRTFNSSRLTFPGLFVHRSRRPPPFVSDGEWVEVFRVSRVEDKAMPRDVCTEGQLWYWRAPGSGIWLNVGHSLRHGAAPLTPGRSLCAEAASSGYDTVQLAFADLGVAEILDCRAALRGNRTALTRTWELACPPPLASPLRSGLPPHAVQTSTTPPSEHRSGHGTARRAGRDSPPCPCRCDNQLPRLNCALPSATSVGTSPRRSSRSNGRQQLVSS
jgi:hypothetical protein